MTDITENLYAERDIMAMGNYYMRHVDRMTREGLHAKSDIAAELGFRDMEIDRLRARVAELEAAKGEPGVWLRDQRGHYEGRETLDPMFYLGARNPGRGANGATYSPFYAAPPAPRVDVDAISDEALNAAWSYIIFNAENEQTEAVYDMRAALRAIFNTKDK